MDDKGSSSHLARDVREQLHYAIVDLKNGQKKTILVGIGWVAAGALLCPCGGALALSRQGLRPGAAPSTCQRRPALLRPATLVHRPQEGLMHGLCPGAVGHMGRWAVVWQDQWAGAALQHGC